MKKGITACKYGCGAEFPNTPEGRVTYMRHVQYDCPKNPKSRAYQPSLEEIKEEELLDEKEVLDKIIAEASLTKKRSAIIRMVSPTLDNPEKSLKTLAEALRLADIQPGHRNLILQNWASHVGIDDLKSILEKDIEREETLVEKSEEDIKRLRGDVRERLELLQLRKEIAVLERELSEEETKFQISKKTETYAVLKRVGDAQKSPRGSIFVHIEKDGAFILIPTIEEKKDDD